MLRSGDRVRITAQLIDGHTDRHLWGQSYERDLRNVISLQGEVARAIANEIQVELTPQEQAHLSRTPTVNPEAYQAYLRGLNSHDLLTLDGLKKALNYFNRAIEIDPTFAAPHVGLARTYYHLSNWWLPPQESIPRAQAEVKKALALDEVSADAHALNALFRSNYEFRWATAENEYRRALDLYPGSAETQHWYGLTLMVLGRFEEAQAQLDRAREADPLTPDLQVDAIWPIFYARDYDGAISRLEGLIQAQPDLFLAHSALGEAYEQKRDWAAAIAQLEKARELGGNPWVSAALARTYAAKGDKAQALRLVNELITLSKKEYVSSYSVATVYASLRNPDQAFVWLEKGYKERCEDMTFLKIDPRIDPLRSDPRFQDLLYRMNFPP